MRDEPWQLVDNVHVNDVDLSNNKDTEPKEDHSKAASHH
jgi:hypothetical protein